MQSLNPKFSIDSFFLHLTQADKSILMLDYDGTLSPFTHDRENAVPYEGVPDRLEKLNNLPDTKIVIVSGRDIAMLKRLLPMKNLPELYGSHGGEYYSKSNGYELLVSNDVKNILSDVKKWADEQSYESQFELKPLSCAFHWRGKEVREIEHMKSEIDEKWSDIVNAHNMEMHPFDGGIEFKLSSVNKGNAVKRVIDNIDLSQTPVAYLGDDRTDEDAFEALGDSGLKVLVHEKKRDTLADICITPPDELYEFLDKWYNAVTIKKS